MATTVISGPGGGIIVGKPKWRPLESEGNLAMLLLLPTIALLLMFIAYPFMRGILLAVTNSKVGVIGDFVGFENFARLLKDPIFYAVVYNTFLYTFVTTVFKLILGLWLALLLNRDFKFKAFTRAFILLPFIVPTVLACFAWKWMFDPTFSVLNWMLFKSGHRRCGRRRQLARRWRSCDAVDHDREHLARRAVLRHFADGGSADHQP